jgi:hypothetical protein
VEEDCVGRNLREAPKGPTEGWGGSSIVLHGRRSLLMLGVSTELYMGKRTLGSCILCTVLLYLWLPYS